MNRIGQLSMIVATSTALCLVAGCSKDTPPAQQPQATQGQFPQGAYPQQPGGYPQQPGAYPQQPGGYPQPGGQPPAAGTGFPLPGLPQGGASGASGGTAQALDANLATLAVAPLTLFANSEAPGMGKEGPTVAGNFQEGQTLEGSFTFQPGKCYTLVAAAAGISQLELEMQYVTPIPGLAPTIAKSSQKGTQVSIGGKANCLRPVSPFPASAKFIVRAAKGAGVAAAQLYVK